MIKVTEYKQGETAKNKGIIEYQNKPKKENESHTELRKSEDSINTEIVETKKLFNMLRSNFSREEIKKLRGKFHTKEEEDSLTKKEEKSKLRREIHKKNWSILF